ncbi:MAG: hypothetical protein WBG50_04805 [Desulfomonilaceae bacterium]
MRRFLLIFLLILCFTGMSLAASQGDNFPAAPAAAGPAHGTPLSSAQQKMFYGYVPPPPIRHTWPGGYRVIFHELANTLMDHILGQY